MSNYLFLLLTTYLTNGWTYFGSQFKSQVHLTEGEWQNSWEDMADGSQAGHLSLGILFTLFKRICTSTCWNCSECTLGVQSVRFLSSCAHLLNNYRLCLHPPFLQL